MTATTIGMAMITILAVPLDSLAVDILAVQGIVITTVTIAADPIIMDAAAEDTITAAAAEETITVAAVTAGSVVDTMDGTMTVAVATGAN